MKMFPKYGLFDFFEFKSVEVVLTDNIHWCDDKSRSSLESGGVVTKVRWDKCDSKKRGVSGNAKLRGSTKQAQVIEHNAKLLKVHGMK